MALAPLYDLRTGEEIAECPGTLAELETLSGEFYVELLLCSVVCMLTEWCVAPQVGELLRRIGEAVPRGHEDRRRKLKQAFGVRTQVI